MAMPYAATPPVPAPLGLPSLAFWLACPFIVSAVLLSVVALVALFRAPRTDAVRVLSIFAAAFRSAATRAHRGDQPELDSDAGIRNAGPGTTAAGDPSKEAS